MTYFLPHDHWIYRTATQWSPLRRWAATAFLVIIIAAPWWALSFRHLLKNVRTYKLELNNPIGAQEIQQLQQQRDTLQTQLNTSGRLQADYVFSNYRCRNTCQTDT